MVHEFTQNDRKSSLPLCTSALTTLGDDHVLYTGSDIKGYSNAVAKAKAAGPTLSDDQIYSSLCNDDRFAGNYGFLGSQYAKNHCGRIGDDSPKFDVDSIMMYPSWGFAEDEDACQKGKTKYPLLNYPQPEYQSGGEKIPEMIEDLEVPSAGDIAWLKQYYPPDDLPTPAHRARLCRGCRNIYPRWCDSG